MRKGARDECRGTERDSARGSNEERQGEVRTRKRALAQKEE